MYETAAVRYFRRLLEKMRIQSHIVPHQNVAAETIDFGLRKYLGREADYADAIRKTFDLVEERTIYKVKDSYHCNYVFFILPETQKDVSLIVGPYLSAEVRAEQLLKETDGFGIPPSVFRDLESFYQNIPILSDDTHLMMMLSTLAEDLWGSGNAYRFLDLGMDQVLQISIPERKTEENSMMQMRMIEQRYAYENELMDKVSKGLWHRASMMLNAGAMDQLEQRTADVVRNQKNFCIICNTLLRKAAEKGGVHPLHLDRMSSQYARRIEQIVVEQEGRNLLLEMTQSYCRLVCRHNIKGYSALIQKVITYIETEIASDLSLKKLAVLHNVSPEYLSALFHKETKKTLTRFINDKRLELGASYLQTTNWQIQTVAEYCGFPDAGYFAKLFRQRYGVSPKAFRDRPEHFPVKE